MYLLGDFAEFARKKGSRDKQKRKRRSLLRTAALIGGGGLVGGLAANKLLRSPTLAQIKALRSYGQGQYLQGAQEIDDLLMSSAKDAFGKYGKPGAEDELMGLLGRLQGKAKIGKKKMRRKINDSIRGAVTDARRRNTKNAGGVLIGATGGYGLSLVNRNRDRT